MFDPTEGGRWYPFLCVVGLFLAGGCAAAREATASPAYTLVSNPQAPRKWIERVYGPGWDTLKDLPYDACVILEGRLSAAREVENLRVQQAFPDNRRVAMAKALCTREHFSPVGIGTMVRQRAVVDCYFFEQTQQQPEALPVAWREGGQRGSQ